MSDYVDMPWLIGTNQVAYVCGVEECPDFGVAKIATLTTLAANVLSGPPLAFCLSCGHAIPIREIG